MCVLASADVSALPGTFFATPRGTGPSPRAHPVGSFSLANSGRDPSQTPGQTAASPIESASPRLEPTPAAIRQAMRDLLAGPRGSRDEGGSAVSGRIGTESTTQMTAIMKLYTAHLRNTPPGVGCVPSNDIKSLIGG